MKCCDLCGTEDAKCNVYHAAVPTPIICAECFDLYREGLHFMIASVRERGISVQNPVLLHLTEVFCFTIVDQMNGKLPETPGEELSDFLVRTVLGTTLEPGSSSGRAF